MYPFLCPPQAVSGPGSMAPPPCGQNILCTPQLKHCQPPGIFWFPFILPITHEMVDALHPWFSDKGALYSVCELTPTFHIFNLLLLTWDLSQIHLACAKSWDSKVWFEPYNGIIPPEVVAPFFGAPLSVCVCVCVLGIFKIGSHKLFYPGWLRAMILLISASWVARITGVSHQHPGFLLTVLHFLILRNSQIFSLPIKILSQKSICPGLFRILAEKKIKGIIF
jgi:hypothetical protein